jgi:aminodeoxychorismate lyase
MTVFLNGEFVPEEKAVVSIFDRSFLYGDGLFETIRVFNGQPFRWAAHLERLQRGAEFLRIRVPFSGEALRGFAGQLVKENQAGQSLLRVTLSRGAGVRGYSPKGAERPCLAMSLHPAPAIDGQQPPQWRIVTSSFRLPAGEPLAQFKTCNKLPQILARAEADAAGAEEAVLLNTDNEAAEGTSSNLFWISEGGVCTPPLSSGILPGVTRDVVSEICRKLGITFRQAAIGPKKLLSSEGVFFSLSSVGIAEAVRLDGKSLKQSAWVRKLHTAYWELVEEESR